jgi:uncharacterized protein (DUF433 family)
MRSSLPVAGELAVRPQVAHRVVAPTPTPHYTESMDYTTLLTLEPGKRGGKPCLRRMRITVYDVLSYLAAGMTQEELLEDFPCLTPEDIRACLSYAADRERSTLVAA